jgi:hypothetical protein
MLEKNKDTLQKDLLVLSESSKQKLMNVLFPPSEGDQRTSKVTLGGQFRKQLDALMTALNATEPHYIRCIKPNSEKQADLFHGFMSLQQLRYAGVFEAVRIRQTGYPFRYSHENFLKRCALAPSSCIGFEARSLTHPASSLCHPQVWFPCQGHPEEIRPQPEAELRPASQEHEGRLVQGSGYGRRATPRPYLAEA